MRTSSAVLDLTTYPTKLLSLWSPWWWFICYGGKRVENRPWRTNYRGGVWLHAALKGEPNVEQTIADTLRVIPLPRGRKPPDVDLLNASAGCIVGRARIVGCEENTPRVCLGDPWAQEGAFGFRLEGVEALPVSIPWKGGQGLAEVRASDVLAVQIITEHGGVYVPTSNNETSRALFDLFGAPVPLEQTIERLTEAKQLRHEKGAYFVRNYSEKLSAAYKVKKPTDDDAPNQGSFGW